MKINKVSSHVSPLTNIWLPASRWAENTDFSILTTWEHWDQHIIVWEQWYIQHFTNWVLFWLWMRPPSFRETYKKTEPPLRPHSLVYWPLSTPLRNNTSLVTRFWAISLALVYLKNVLLEHFLSLYNSCFPAKIGSALAVVSI